MERRIIVRVILILLVIPPLVGCNLPALRSPFSTGGDALPITETLAPLPETIVTFQVAIPDNSPPDEAVYLSVLDEITGLALNADTYLMQMVDSSATVSGNSATRSFTVSLPFAIGSVVKYRYERQAGSIRVAEHSSDGSPVRYRLFLVDGPGSVVDVVSRWTDTAFASLVGRITGQVMDSATGEPLPDVLVSAGGSHSITSADGKFRLEGLPPGLHNLVTYALDDSYQTFQQGALVEAESTTPANVYMTLMPTVKGIFVVRVPKETPPVVPLRLAGNLYQLGNSFATLTGGMSSVAGNMPVMSVLPDGRYTLTLTLPVGADLRYKYTLGDGFWNAEHKSDGSFRLRQIVVPESNFLQEDEVETWFAGEPNSIAFDVQVPDSTPANDSVSIQISPLFGWTEPFPMWNLGGGRWAYILYSPLNLPGNLMYRYCRNEQCGLADDVMTPGQFGPGRPATIDSGPSTHSDQVTEWLNLPWAVNPLTVPQSAVPNRGIEFWSGIEFTNNYHPSWRSRIPQALDLVQTTSANRIILKPTWTFGRLSPGNIPPVLQPLPGRDMLEVDLIEAMQQSQNRGLNVVLFPTPQLLANGDEWWATAARDFSWWVAWFEQYKEFLLHHAEIAQEYGASAIILGGELLEPALPGGTLADGSPSNVPENAENIWRGIISELRERFTGALLWAMPYESAVNPPPFLDAVDSIYLLWSLSSQEQVAAPQVADLEGQIAASLDNTILTLYTIENKPIIFAFSSPADPDPQVQFNAYQAALDLVSSRDWITGFVSRGFYPPVALLDNSPSIHGKPTLDLLRYWFQGLLGKATSN